MKNKIIELSLPPTIMFICFSCKFKLECCYVFLDLLKTPYEWIDDSLELVLATIK